ncbi:MAG: 4'-phosphopantetheinyl transferase superfamily protein [Fluviicola sp.]|nr:4'-phosphopantetheinyl transferase superfamily protein [Fluviicola sp.]
MNYTLGSKLLAIRLDNTPDVLTFEALLLHLSPERRVEIRGFYREKDQWQSLIAELLIRKVLIQRCGMTNEKISFIRSEYGKPILAGTDAFHFNVSHAGDWVVCAIDNKPIGVDVEKVKTANLAVSRSFFSLKEHFDICNVPDPNDRFFDYWTLKESFIKHSGKGLSQALNAFTILFSENGGIGIESDGKRLDYLFLKQYSLAEGYKLAVCGANELLPESIEYCSMDAITSFFLQA